ncbi:MAG: potassium-transporting ATPase subunit F [Parachlamydiaceae bacterium]|nr:MAG: potassium-transporting ATPase subunit F [Parachlamydiaceae bacterium]
MYYSNLCCRRNFLYLIYTLLNPEKF